MEEWAAVNKNELVLQVLRVKYLDILVLSREKYEPQAVGEVTSLV